MTKFLKSPEWKEVVSLFLAANAKEVLIEILKRAKEAYKEYEDVVKAIEEALKAIEEGKAEEAVTKLEELKKRVEEIAGKNYPVRISEGKIVIEGDKLEAYVEEDSGEYKIKLEVRGRKVVASWEEAKEVLLKAKELAETLSPP